jgi:flagellar biosynthesis protein FlhA
MPGTPTKDPVFGMEATWVPREFAPQAELTGATVIDRSSVITAHLAEVVRSQAGRLLSRQDVQQLVDGAKAAAPVVVEELQASAVTLGDVQRVLANLLEEQVPVRDLVRILEAITERGSVTRDVDALTEAVRARLGSAVATPHLVGGRLVIVTIDPLTEHGLLESLRTGDAGTYLALDPETAEAFTRQVVEAVREGEARGARPVLVCGAALRSAVRRLVRNVDPALAVLAYGELGDSFELEMMGVIDLAPATV